MSQSKTLLETFGINESLKLDRRDQIREIRKKMDKIINLEKNKLKLTNVNQKFTNFHEIPQNKISREEIGKNGLVIVTSLTSLFYFTKVSDFLTRVNSLAIFKPIFIFTFCIAPIGISLYFSKLDRDFKKFKYLEQTKRE